MDLTKEYILMCEKAAELQNLSPIKDDFYKCQGNFFYDKNEKESFSVGDINTSNGTNDEFTSDYEPENCVWLPRQDQLQEMIPQDRSYSLHKRLKDWQLECGQIMERVLRDGQPEDVLEYKYESCTQTNTSKERI